MRYVIRINYCWDIQSSLINILVMDLFGCKPKREGENCASYVHVAFTSLVMSKFNS
jgi:hypothetical protein